MSYPLRHDAREVKNKQPHTCMGKPAEYMARIVHATWIFQVRSPESYACNMKPTSAPESNFHMVPKPKDHWITTNESFTTRNCNVDCAMPHGAPPCPGLPSALGSCLQCQGGVAGLTNPKLWPEAMCSTKPQVQTGPFIRLTS